MNKFNYLLLGSLILASCSRQAEFERPGETGGETVEVTTDIQVNILPMQSIGSPATRSAANGKPEKGEALHVTYGSDATTRVQTGTDPMSTAESTIYHAYIVQFDGTAPTSTAVWVSDDIRGQLALASPITCRFKMAAGKKNRIYVIANSSITPTPGMTLAAFLTPVPFTPSESVLTTGVPMSAMQDAGLDEALDVFQLKSTLAKVKITSKTAGATLKLKNYPTSYSFFAGSGPGDNAVRPSGMSYDNSGYSITSGVTYYVPENMSGRNDLLVSPLTRALGMAPVNAMYVEITYNGTTYNHLLGDGSVQDFNVARGYAYDIRVAVVYPADPYDLRVGNPLPAGTAIVDLNAQAGGKTANCYVAGANTWYMFNSTVMGNGAFTPANGAPDAADIIPSRLNPASADVLWETLNTDTKPAPGAVVNNNLYFLKDRRILFKSGSTQGNAVIAARDASGNIIWSWHIWRINDTPKGILLKDITDGKGFLVSGIQMMDRNLGALEVPTTTGTVLSMGFLYQWGRKDPFVNTSTNDGTKKQPWALATNVDFGADKSTTPASSVAMSIASPTTFYFATPASRYSWCTVYNNNYWGTPSTSNTVKIDYKTYDCNPGSKTIYDPCPPGWRVPSEYVYANAAYCDTSSKFNKGFDFKTKLTSSASIFLPAAGRRYYNDGFSIDQGGKGYYWTSSTWSDPGNIHACDVYFSNTGLLLSSSIHALGHSVRCVQEY